MSKIILVAHPETGAIFTPTGDKNTFKMQIREQGEGVTVSAGGYIGFKNDRVAFPALDKRVCESAAFKNLKHGDAFPLSGIIQRRLSLEPQYADHQTVKKGSEEDAEEALMHGKPYYQSYVFVPNTNAKSDIWVDENGVEVVETMNLESAEEKAAKTAAEM